MQASYRNGGFTAAPTRFRQAMLENISIQVGKVFDSHPNQRRVEPCYSTKKFYDKTNHKITESQTKSQFCLFLETIKCNYYSEISFKF